MIHRYRISLGTVTSQRDSGHKCPLWVLGSSPSDACRPRAGRRTAAPLSATSPSPQDTREDGAARSLGRSSSAGQTNKFSLTTASCVPQRNQVSKTGRQLALLAMSGHPRYSGWAQHDWIEVSETFAIAVQCFPRAAGPTSGEPQVPSGRVRKPHVCLSLLSPGRQAPGYRHLCRL